MPPIASPRRRIVSRTKSSCRSNFSVCERLSFSVACLAVAMASPSVCSSLMLTFDSKARAYSSSRLPV